MLLAEFCKRIKNQKARSKLSRNRLSLAGTRRGVWNGLASAGKTGEIPFRHGRQSLESIIQCLFLLIHPALGSRGRQIQRSNRRASKPLIRNLGGSAVILTDWINTYYHILLAPSDRRHQRNGRDPFAASLPFRLAGESPRDAARERHSPVWRQAKRQSGDWRSRALAIFILRLIILVSLLPSGSEARLTLLWRWHKVTIQTEKR